MSDNPRKGGLSAFGPAPASPLSPLSTRLRQVFTQALLSDFAQHGASIISEVRERSPEEYLSLVAAIATTQADEGGSMTIEDFNSTLAAAAASVRGDATIH